jgi:phosphate:Na+ symporter
MQAAGIVLGANIGTTVTGWIVAIIGFKFQIGMLALPAIAIGFFIRFINRDGVKPWGEFLLGFGILFMGLGIMSDSVGDLRGSDMIMNFMSTYRATGILSTMVVVAIGTVITMTIQSSSATMAMTMALAVNGMIDFYTACALILGENIGTTITANIAAVGSSVDARRTARIHFLFNLFGVLWISLIMRQLFIPFIDAIIPGNPFSSDPAIRAQTIADHMAAFHTGFNIINTLVFLPFLKYLARAAMIMVPDEKKGEDEEQRLRYISTGLVSVPAISLSQAKFEVERMMEVVIEMYHKIIDVFNNPEAKLGETIQEIQKLENHVDMLEIEISEFLVRVSRNPLSKEDRDEISTMLNKVDQLESIGDQCDALLHLIRLKYDKKLTFSDEGNSEIREIAGKVNEFLYLVSRHIGSINSNIMPEAEVLENRINELRKEFRKGHIRRLGEDKCHIEPGIIFLDMLTRFEKIGDLAYNIAETISGERIF